MSTENRKPAPGQKSGQAAPPPPPPITPDTEAAAPRTRSKLSTEKKLAIALAGVLAIFTRKEALAILKPGESDTIGNATALAAEVNGKTLGVIDARLKAVTSEIAEAGKLENLTKPGGADAMKKLAQEMGRLQTRRAALVESASA